MGRATPKGPTRWQWRRMVRRHRRRARAPSIGLRLVAVAAALAAVLQAVSPGSGWSSEDAAARVTSLRGGDAWKGGASGPVAPAGKIVGPVTRVRDGDTIEVSGRPIRFADLDCAETGTYRGRRAGARMRAIVSGKTLSCRLTGDKSYDRWIGACRLPDGRNLATVMVRTGACTRWRG